MKESCMKNPQMILKKAWQAVLAVAVVALIAAGSVFAATEFLSGGDYKAFYFALSSGK